MLEDTLCTEAVAGSLVLQGAGVRAVLCWAPQGRLMTIYVRRGHQQVPGGRVAGAAGRALCCAGGHRACSPTHVCAEDIDESLVAESLVLRGARQSGAQVSPAQAAEALEASLLATGARLPVLHPQTRSSACWRLVSLADHAQVAEALHARLLAKGWHACHFPHTGCSCSALRQRRSCCSDHPQPPHCARGPQKPRHPTQEPFFCLHPVLIAGRSFLMNSLRPQVCGASGTAA